MTTTIATNKPPRFLCNNDYSRWKINFESFILKNDSDLWNSFTEAYFWPCLEGKSETKTLRQMSEDERKEYKRDRKAYETLKTCLPNDVAACFRSCNTAFELWNALAERFGENDQNKESVKADEVQNQNLASKCHDLQESLHMYMRENADLRKQVNDFGDMNKALKEDVKAYKAKLEAKLTEVSDLKAKILCKQAAIDSYLVEISLLNKEKTEAENEVREYKRKQSNLSAQTMVLDKLVQHHRNPKSKSGIGYCVVPPPPDYVPMPDMDNDFKAPTFVSATEPAKAEVEEDEVSVGLGFSSQSSVADNFTKADKGKKKVSDSASTSKASKKSSEPEPSKSYIKEIHIHSSSEPSKCTSFCKDKHSFTKVTKPQPSSTNEKGKKAATRVTKPQPTTEKEKVKEVICYYCKTRGHLVKNCTSLANKRQKRKDMKKKQQDKQPNKVQSSFKREIFTKPSTSPKQVWRVKKPNANPSSNDQFKGLKMIDVLVKDAFGKPITIKAWIASSITSIGSNSSTWKSSFSSLNSRYSRMKTQV